MLAAWIAVAGMVSAVGLFNALLLAYSRIPFVMATDGLLPSPLARTDRRGTPRVAVLFAAVCYSLFMLLPFSGLVVADVLLYSLALMLELASLVALRVREPTLRGAFRIPVGTRAVAVLAALPMSVLLLVVVLSFADGENGLPAVLGAAVAIGLGPICWAIATRHARRDRYGSCLTIAPPFITKRTSRIARMSRDGSPRTATRSASRPAFTAPICASMCSIFASVVVAARSA